jgi:diguanylate cyclase (GGDEF)-like protein/PAS domain S-box-containing protein
LKSGLHAHYRWRRRPRFESVLLCASRLPGLLLAWLAAWFAIASPALAQESVPDERPASITVTLDDNYPPYIFRDAGGDLQGILKDSWALWSRKTGIRVKLDAKDWAQALAQMAAGQADVIDTIFYTDARARLYDFSTPYATIEVPIYFDKRIGGLTDAKSLRGFTVGVKEGDACIDWLTEHGVSSFRRYHSYETLINAAGVKDVRVLCIDAPPANYFLYKLGLESEFRFTAPLYTGEFHWAVRKGNATVRKIVAEGFAQISDAERREIDDRWTGQLLVSGRFAKYTGYALLVGVGMTLILILLNWSLRRRVAVRTSELIATLNELNGSKKHFEALVSTTPVGVFETDAGGACIYVNDRWLEISGLPREDVLGSGWVNALHPDYRERFQAAWMAAVQKAQPLQMEMRLRRPDGKDTWVLAQASPVQGEQGNLTGYIGSITDISEIKAAETRIAYLAHHDALTELPNRVLARDRAEVAMAFADRSGEKVALLFLDLDHFKTVNDSLGHTTGDALLRAVSARLRSCVRDTDTISRQGGDEFLIVLPEVPDADAIAAVASKVLGSMSAPIVIEGQELATSVSAGIAVFPDDGNDFDTLLKKADTAMYHAKEAGRNTYRFYTEQMNVDAVEHLRIQAGLRRALDNGEFLLHYQPQFELATGKLVGAEALIRWDHPEMGLIAPARFIPIAETSGMIVAIGNWVLREACRQAAGWCDTGFPDVVVAVNLSAMQFKRGDLQQTIVGVLNETGLDPTRLELELTESILIGNTEMVLDTVRKLKAIGIKLSLDDFGTGYSSLSYLKRFPLDKLKIDQSFVRDMIKDGDNAAIVRAIIQLARSLNLRTIAEGVEDQAVVEHLRVLHCDEGQGYHFARPMPASEFQAFLEAHREAVGAA